jgi:hypothetical protein
MEEKIIEIVSGCFGVDVSGIKSKCRKRELAEARQVCMYLIMKYTTKTLSDCASMVNIHQHGTVIHARKAVGNLIDTDKVFATKLRLIEKAIEENKSVPNMGPDAVWGESDFFPEPVVQVWSDTPFVSPFAKVLSCTNQPFISYKTVR